ncbi:AAA family ATPase [Agrococcus sp. SGAir0287]|uniref:AAA family ATPase n=1 Tax=Agrococcus sp. SGAir0287 TaxID=2070347 RepID=UPI0010CCBAA5|nr:regulator [Agrococcus sp. SGAir0287]QCR18736.1 regulator [Agrococcus sp. SGAir0287]
MTTFAISAPLEREDALAELARRHGHRVAVRAARASELVERLAHVEVDAVLVSPTAPHLDGELVRACDARGVRVLAVVDDAADAGAARAFGVESVRFADGFPAIEWAIVSPHASREQRPRGRVLTVWGPAGAPGCTTAAIGLATELAARGQRVALVDADSHAASIAPALGLLDEAPGFAAAARLVRTGSLTVDELGRVAQTLQTALGDVQVLTGITRAGRWPELAADRVAGVLDACRDWVDWTIVDVASSLERDEEISSDVFGPRRNAATIAALRAADRVVAVASGDPIGMTRLLRAYPDLVDVVPSDRIAVVVNKVRTGGAGLAPATSVAQTLQRFGGIAPSAQWPLDQGAVDAALLSARPLIEVAGRSRLRRAMQATAVDLLPAQPTRTAARAAARGARRRGMRFALR